MPPSVVVEHIKSSLPNISEVSLNSTIAFAIDQQSLLQYSVYVVLGVVVTALNGIIFITILRHKHLRLRKELLVVSGSAFADCLTGFACLTSGIRRLYLVNVGPFGNRTPLSCLGEIFTIFFSLSNQLVPMMLASISIDRFLAVHFVIRYISFGLKYALMLILIPYGYVVVSWFVLVYYAYQQPDVPTLTLVCIGSAGGIKFDIFAQCVQLSAVAVCVLVYSGVVVGLICSRKSQFPEIQKQQMLRQAKMTKTTSIVALCSFFFYILPTGVDLILNLSGVTSVTYQTILPYMTWLMAFHSVVSSAIYLAKNVELRMGLFARKANQVNLISVY